MGRWSQKMCIILFKPCQECQLNYPELHRLYTWFKFNVYQLFNKKSSMEAVGFGRTLKADRRIDSIDAM